MLIRSFPGCEELLFSTGVTFFLINVITSAALVAVFLLNGPLTVACMLPTLFAMIATLGTLNIMGRPLDIPGLMLSIVVFGIGIDYSVFFVRSYQRYGTLNHPAFGQIRMAVFLPVAPCWDSAPCGGPTIRCSKAPA
jgi:predicted RND superfamily exporter protein